MLGGGGGVVQGFWFWTAVLSTLYVSLCLNGNWHIRKSLQIARKAHTGRKGPQNRHKNDAYPLNR
jgi:hypothetical protein